MPRSTIPNAHIPPFLIGSHDGSLAAAEFSSSSRGATREKGGAATESWDLLHTAPFIKYNRGVFFNLMVEAVKFLFMHWNIDDDMDG